MLLVLLEDRTWLGWTLIYKHSVLLCVRCALESRPVTSDQRPRGRRDHLRHSLHPGGRLRVRHPSKGVHRFGSTSTLLYLTPVGWILFTFVRIMGSHSHIVRLLGNVRSDGCRVAAASARVELEPPAAIGPRVLPGNFLPVGRLGLEAEHSSHQSGHAADDRLAGAEPSGERVR